MSGLERRLQLLLDHDRYDRVAAEAQRTGRSVSAMIREAIDVRFPSSDRQRDEALAVWLEQTKEPREAIGEDWADIKRRQYEELHAELSAW